MKCILKEGFVWVQFTTGLSGIFTPGGKAAGFCSHPSHRPSAAIYLSLRSAYNFQPQASFLATTVGPRHQMVFGRSHTHCPTRVGQGDNLGEGELWSANVGKSRWENKACVLGCKVLQPSKVVLSCHGEARWTYIYLTPRDNNTQKILQTGKQKTYQYYLHTAGKLSGQFISVQALLSRSPILSFSLFNNGLGPAKHSGNAHRDSGNRTATCSWWLLSRACLSVQSHSEG